MNAILIEHISVTTAAVLLVFAISMTGRNGQWPETEPRPPRPNSADPRFMKTGCAEACEAERRKRELPD